MKRTIGKWILVSTLLIPRVHILANVNSHIEYREGLDEKRVNLAQDVFIEGIYENATLYVGADIRIKGSVDKQATQQAITWQVTGNNSVINFEDFGNRAKITGKAQGTVWVMARAIDESDRAREYTVNVRNYPKDVSSQVLITTQVTPVLTRPFQQGQILQVEVSKTLVSSQQREKALDSYMRKLSTIGRLGHERSYVDEYYEYHIINVGANKVEVRIAQNDSAYAALKNTLINASKYNDGKDQVQEVPEVPGEMIDPPIHESEKPRPEEPSKPPSSGGGKPKPEEPSKPPSSGGGKPKPEEPSKPPSGGDEKPKPEEPSKPPSGGDEKPKPEEPKPPNEENQKPDKGVIESDNVLILGGSGTSVNDPLIITVEESLKSQEKVKIIQTLLTEMSRNKSINFIRKREGPYFTSYILRVSDNNSNVRRIKRTSKNDFFIEIRVEKGDEEAYVPIIEMLDDLEKESVQGVENKPIQQIKEEKGINNKSKERNQKNTLIDKLLRVDFAREELKGIQVLEEKMQVLEGELQKESILKENMEENDLLKNIFSIGDSKEGKSFQRSTHREKQENEKSGFKFNSIFVFLSLGAAFCIKNLL